MNETQQERCGHDFLSSADVLAQIWVPVRNAGRHPDCLHQRWHRASRPTAGL